MSSIVDICNRSLSHVGRSPITAVFPTDGSAESKECNRHYNPMRRELLRSSDWKFATTTVILTAHSEDPPPGWSYRFQYPSNCLKALRIVHATRAKTEPVVEFDIELNAAGTEKTILSDFEVPSLTFVFDLKDPVLFDSAFEEVFSWRLAMEICIPLTRDEEIYQLCVSGFRSSMSNAIAQSRNEGVPGRRRKPTTLEARS